MSAWQPIKTAPKDGTRVLLRFLDNAVAGGYFQSFEDGDSAWYLDIGDTIMVEPTEWMEIPK